MFIHFPVLNEPMLMSDTARFDELCFADVSKGASHSILVFKPVKEDQPNYLVTHFPCSIVVSALC